MLSWPQFNAIKIFSVFSSQSLCNITCGNFSRSLFFPPQPQYYWFIAAIGSVYFYRSMCDVFVHSSFLCVSLLSFKLAIYCNWIQWTICYRCKCEKVRTGQWNLIGQFRGTNANIQIYCCLFHNGNFCACVNTAIGRNFAST